METSSSVSATEYTSFDILGRVTGHLICVSSLAIIVTSLASFSFAQDVCPVIKQPLRKAVGRVLEIGSEKKPVPKTTVELFAIRDDDVFVASTKTDSNGRFEFERLKKGEYRLVVHFIVNGETVAPRYDFILKITRTNAEKTDKRLRVTLGPDCFSSSVSIEKAFP